MRLKVGLVLVVPVCVLVLTAASNLPNAATITQLTQPEMQSTIGGVEQQIGNSKCVTLEGCLTVDYHCSSYTGLECNYNEEGNKVPNVNRKLCEPGGTTIGETCSQLAEEQDQGGETNWTPCYKYIICEWDIELGACLSTAEIYDTVNVPGDCSDST
mgnify:CR=1 FL=1|tara:strand:- start:1191 stop:1661 length:471 start_codon:yes stop_codon:yes gene_type:complete